MASLIDEILDDRPFPLRTSPLGVRAPMTAPAAVVTEGNRINASLAAGTYGAQPLTSNAGVTPAITIAPASSTVNAGDTFFQQPSIWEQNRNPAQLRQELKLDELKMIAAQRKHELSRAPIQDAYELARLEHERAATAAVGESTRFNETQDAAAMSHVSRFADYMTNAPEVGTPEFQQYVLQGVRKYPRMATTVWGKDVLSKISKEHDSIADLITKMPGGMDISSVSVSKGGPTVTVQPRGTDKQLEAELKEGYKLSLGQVRDPINAKVGRFEPGSKKWIGDPNGNVVMVDNGEGKQVSLSVAEYQRFGGKFDKKTIAERALLDPEATEAHKAAARKLLGK